jgi:hypothetical protein
MQVQHHPHLRQTLVDLSVNRPRRGVDIRSPGTGFIIGVQQQQIAGADARKVFPLRIQQEFFTVREMAALKWLATASCIPRWATMRKVAARSIRVCSS